MRHILPFAQTADHGVLATPVEPEGFAHGKLQRNKRFTFGRCNFLFTPMPHELDDTA